ncbi:hypothetical protein PWT90_06489 [Aphanocladium album]|nr:hypothetical protein PWT90_06489 [Aphanocladium album]
MPKQSSQSSTACPKSRDPLVDAFVWKWPEDPSLNQRQKVIPLAANLANDEFLHMILSCVGVQGCDLINPFCGRSGAESSCHRRGDTGLKHRHATLGLAE